jgi:cysteine desulfurase
VSSPAAAATPGPIYLDYHATTPIDARVAEVVYRHMVDGYANPSSRDHVLGDRAAAVVEEARGEVAALVGVSPKRVIFTSGATEAINLAIKGFVRGRPRTKPVRIALPRTEHKAVLDTAAFLQARGEAELLWLPIDERGRVETEGVTAACAAGAELVCVMAANNEIGTIQPLTRLAAIVHEAGAVFFSDVTQAAGKVPLALAESRVGLAALSAHKLYGPPGVGALIFDPAIALEPILHGGGHERQRRSGSLNMPGIAGFGAAARLRRDEMAADEPRIASLRDRLADQLQAGIPGLVQNGDREWRLAGNLHVSIPDVPNTVMIARIRNQLAIATGSACTSGAPSPSHVLRAIGLGEDLVRGALRIGIGKFSSAGDIDAAAALLITAAANAKTAMVAADALYPEP